MMMTMDKAVLNVSNSNLDISPPSRELSLTMSPLSAEVVCPPSTLRSSLGGSIDMNALHGR